MKIQEFALENIYCSPTEDSQYRYRLIWATEKQVPVMTTFYLFDRTRIDLPDRISRWHILLIGGTSPEILNLRERAPRCMCSSTGWINASEDMNERTFVLQIYDEKGVNFPRKEIFYKFLQDGSIVFALRYSEPVKRHFTISDMKYLRVYSYRYYGEREGNKSIDHYGIEVKNKQNIIDTVVRADSLNPDGKYHVLYYFNGRYQEKLSINGEADGYVEFVIDKTLINKDVRRVRDLKTFMSTLDSMLKYFFYRNRKTQYIEYEDDLEIFITSKYNGIEKGLYYFQNKSNAVRNVTDKDYALRSDYVINQARIVMQENKVELDSINIVLLSREPKVSRSLVYSDMKIHELYKLPFNKQFDAMITNAYSTDAFRVEYLENHPYWKVAGAEYPQEIKTKLAMDALGYSATNYYFGLNPLRISDYGAGGSAYVPPLFRERSIAYFYNKEGVMTSIVPTTDFYVPLTNMDEDTYVEFVQGVNTSRMDGSTEDRELHDDGDTIPYDKEKDFSIIIAEFDGDTRKGDWVDITNNEKFVTYTDTELTVKHEPTSRFRIIYLNNPALYSFEIELDKIFPIVTLLELDRKGRMIYGKHLDVYPDTLEVFLNGYRLVQDTDFILDFPHIYITAKERIKQLTPKQEIHVRTSGVVLHNEEVNAREVRGYVNHGTLSRNGLYDLRDDRVFSVFIDGRLHMRDSLYFAEDDNTIRMVDPLNGKPYVIVDRFSSLKNFTTLDTLPYFHASQKKDDEISDLFGIVYPEPEMKYTDIIGDHYFIFSPLISIITMHVLMGAIPSTFYTKPYNQGAIEKLLNDEYGDYLKNDPLLRKYPGNIVEIHPHWTGDTIDVNIFQYRFIHRIIDFVTLGHAERVNMSGYFRINTENDIVDKDTVLDVNGIHNPRI